jgi:NADH dehydrogenase
MILVTGGAGVMGSALTTRLRAMGKEVRILALPGDRNCARVNHPGVEIRYGDIAERSQVEGLCEGIDTVYHCAAVIVTDDPVQFDKINSGGTRNLIEEALRAGVSHFIYVSSASVCYPELTQYAASKKTGEALVIDSGLPFSIVRPTLVYNRGKGGLEFDMYLAYLRRFSFVPCIGEGNALKRPVYVEDIINGLTALCDNRGAWGKIYNFSGGEAISMKDFTRLCLRLLGMPTKPLVVLPVWTYYFIAFIMKVFFKHPPLNRQKIAGIIYDANLDPREAIEDLGYNPRKVSEFLPECFPRIPDVQSG